MRTSGRPVRVMVWYGGGCLGCVVDVVQRLPAPAAGMGMDEAQSAAVLGGDAGGPQEVLAGEVDGSVHDPITVLAEDEATISAVVRREPVLGCQRTKVQSSWPVRAPQMSGEALGDAVVTTTEHNPIVR